MPRHLQIVMSAVHPIADIVPKSPNVLASRGIQSLKNSRKNGHDRTPNHGADRARLSLWRLRRNTGNSLFISLLAGNLGRDRSDTDCRLRSGVISNYSRGSTGVICGYILGCHANEYVIVTIRVFYTKGGHSLRHTALKINRYLVFSEIDFRISLAGGPARTSNPYATSPEPVALYANSLVIAVQCARKRDKLGR